MRFSISYALTLALLVGFTSSSEAKPPRFTPAGFQLYYGSDAKIVSTMINQLQTGQVVAVETRSLSKAQMKKLLDEANHVGAKVIGYVSIGELSDLDRKKYQKFVKEYSSKTASLSKNFGLLKHLVVNRNEQFQSQRVDVGSLAWRLFVHHQIEEIYKTGVHGLFLDTVDTVDVYITNKKWTTKRRVQSVNAMIAFIREIKEKYPRKFLMQNRGLNIIGTDVFVGDATGVMITGQQLKKPDKRNPDFVLWEDAFSQTGDWIEAKQKELITIQKNGHCTIFTLGYKVNKISKADFLKKSAQYQFIPAWATSSSTIHQELAH